MVERRSSATDWQIPRTFHLALLDAIFAIIAIRNHLFLLFP